jgi:hypothetical protein
MNYSPLSIADIQLLVTIRSNRFAYYMEWAVGGERF